jgi:hypothetical protein
VAWYALSYRQLLVSFSGGVSDTVLRTICYDVQNKNGTAFSSTGSKEFAEQRKKKMSIELTRSLLLWCTVINYAILLVWFLVFTLARDWMRRFHGRWFRLSDEQFDALHYVGMSIYKIGILLFNLVPFVVLWIVG